jgi:hypothetical protein
VSPGVTAGYEEDIMAGKIFVAKESGVLEMPDGSVIVFTRGVTRVREGHDILKGRENMFEEIGVHYDIEDARSAPQDEPKPQPVAAAPATPDDDDYFPPAPAAKKTAAPRQRGPRKTSGSGS